MKKLSAIHYIIIAAVLFVAGFAWWAYNHRQQPIVLQEFQMVSDGFDAGIQQNEQITKELVAKLTPFLNDTTRPEYPQSLTLMAVATDPVLVYLDSLIPIMERAEKKDYELVTRLMVTDGGGSILENYLENARQTILGLPVWEREDSIYLSERLALTTEYDKDYAQKLGKRTWAEYHFDHVPAVAAHTLLLKFKGDLLNSRNLALERMYEKLMAETDTSGNSN